MSGFSGRGSRSKLDPRRIDDAADDAAGAAAADEEYWRLREAANASDDDFDARTGRDRRDPYRVPSSAVSPRTTRRSTTRRNPIGMYNPGEDWRHDSPPRPPPPPPNMAHVGLATAMTLALLAGTSNSVMNERERQTTMRTLKTQSNILNSAKNKATRIASHMQQVAGGGAYLSWENSVKLEKVFLKLYGDKMEDVIRKLPSYAKRQAARDDDYEDEISTYSSKEVKYARDAINMNIAIIQQQKNALKSKARLETQATKRELKINRALTKGKTNQNRRRARGGRQNTRKKKR